MQLETVQLALSVINLLIIPVLIYVVKLEKRLTILETKMELHDLFVHMNRPPN